MKDAAAKSERLVSGSVRKQVLSFALTALARLVFNSVYSLTDALFVGRGVGDAAMGGVSAVYPFVILQSAIATTIGGGAVFVFKTLYGGSCAAKITAPQLLSKSPASLRGFFLGGTICMHRGMRYVYMLCSKMLLTSAGVSTL